MSQRKKISIIDYGVGNLHSLKKAVQRFTPDVQVTDDKDEISSSSALILPGVGAFKSGMEGLEIRNLTDEVKKAARQNKPILGICLGAQIMLSQGFEFGESEGLGIVPGNTIPFPSLPEKEKIPQIGWNEIYPQSPEKWKNSVLEKLPDKPNVYFVHSYILEPDEKQDILALANYGGYEFCAAIRKGNIYGCQFHPEKSGKIGLSIIESFVNLVKKHA